MEQLSSNLLYIAFFIYLLATVFFAASIRQKKNNEPFPRDRVASIAIGTTVLGFLAQLGFFITRWIASSHAPVSNMFEFTTFFGMMLVAAFILIFLIYRQPLLGVFTMPIALLIIAFASMFPREIQPLIPALKSHWLYIHVTTAALGEAILSISFVAGLIYLVKSVNQNGRKQAKFWLEVILFLLVTVLGFVIITTGFKLFDQSVPKFVKNQQLNTVLWSLMSGLILYLLFRVLLRKRLGAWLGQILPISNLELLDEVGYRSVLIGFPVFSLGALIFAMIWAQVAWNRFWGWDPKEIWAAVTWLFYAAFLHLRLGRNWHGIKSAWLAVVGFIIIMFNLVAVNFVIAGLHSYAGM